MPTFGYQTDNVAYPPLADDGESTDVSYCSVIILYSNLIYDGRSTNKLQNSVILLIFRLGKFRNIHFVGDLILRKSYEFYYDNVTVTSFMNNRYGDVVARWVASASRYRQRTVVRLLSPKGLSANAIQSEMCPV